MKRAVLAALAIGCLVAPAAPALALTPDEDPTTASLSRMMSPTRPLAGWRIALDAGHNGANGTDPAAINALVSDGRGGYKGCNTVGTSTLTGYAESAYTFDVTRRLAAELEALGATVLLTREDANGVGPCVDVRGRFAEDADADLMLSIHGNGSMNPDHEGFFVIVAEPALSASQQEPSLDLAASVIQALGDAGFAESNTIADALSQRSDLATLNFARRPAVLVELGEMRNPVEGALMEEPQTRQAYADALVAAILDWTSNHRRS